MSFRAAIVTLVLAIASVGQSAVAQGIEGAVTVGGQPVGGAAVTLWRTAGTDAPESLASVSTDAGGGFAIQAVPTPADGKVFYLTTKGGGDALALMSVLGTEPPAKVVVNELTTVASVFTSAQFIDGTAIRGNELGLRIAGGNVPNLVDPVTGTWGKVVLDPNNSTKSTTLARLDTLANLVAICGVPDKADSCANLLALTSSADSKSATTLDAIQAIAKTPWAKADQIFALFDKAYPQPKDGARRSAPFVPYLAYTPSDFALMLKFAGYSGGRFGVDRDGNVWSGQNWMAGSQSGVVKNIGGGTIKLAPDGTELSPPITGFTGMGVDGIGWGTGAAIDTIWVGGLNGKIGIFDLEGRPAVKESDFPFTAGEIGGLMGVGVAANGDVWIADGTKNNLLHFPGGSVKDGRIVKVEGLKSPFGIAIDAQNRVWVSNSQSDTVVRFPADDPSKAESFRAGISGRGVALDSKGNLWAASLMALDFPPPTIPDGVSIMKQFQILLGYLKDKLPGNPTGVLNMIRPDGTQPAPTGFDGNKKVFLPWGVAIDGNDDVWFGQFWGRGVGLMTGAEPKAHAARKKTGDVIHIFQSGSIQMITDVAIDPAGNVWAVNNWNNYNVVGDADPPRPISTWGGGDGIVVIYGVAAPVKTPVMGPVRAFSE